ncbi:MAG TPA: hypothetical protein VFE19_06270 [Jatrophihabitantaceae bacterium]|nr:hypothetical protein [Jatrophihabitantaceae bacterium]
MRQGGAGGAERGGVPSRGPPDLLELRIITGGDHRPQSVDGLVPGYLDALTTFVSRLAP